MPKQCSHPDCTYNVFSKGLCQNHWRQQYAKPIKAKDAILKPVQPRKPIKKYQTKAIKKISDTQAKRLKRYRIARDEYFKDYPICQYPNCGSRNITLHHMKGKIGELLWDKRWFKSLCFYHHRIVEESPLEAKILNLSADRL